MKIKDLKRANELVEKIEKCKERIAFFESVDKITFGTSVGSLGEQLSFDIDKKESVKNKVDSKINIKSLEYISFIKKQLKKEMEILSNELNKI